MQRPALPVCVAEMRAVPAGRLSVSVAAVAVDPGFLTSSVYVMAPSSITTTGDLQDL